MERKAQGLPISLAERSKPFFKTLLIAPEEAHLFRDMFFGVDIRLRNSGGTSPASVRSSATTYRKRAWQSSPLPRAAQTETGHSRQEKHWNEHDTNAKRRDNRQPSDGQEPFSHPDGAQHRRSRFCLYALHLYRVIPMFFLSGVARFLFVPLAEAVSFAMLASYMWSRTIVPTLAMYLLSSEDEYHPEEHIAKRWASPALSSRVLKKALNGSARDIGRPCALRSIRQALRRLLSCVLRFLPLAIGVLGAIFPQCRCRPDPSAHACSHRIAH